MKNMGKDSTFIWCQQTKAAFSVHRRQTKHESQIITITNKLHKACSNNYLVSRIRDFEKF